MHQPHYVTETQVVRAVAGEPTCRYIWTTHVIKQMGARGISQPDIECALINGQVTLSELKSDLLWRVEGSDVDGDKIEVIVTVYEEDIAIKVITVF